MKRSVRAFAPASVANAVAGFDVLGFALDQPGDIVTCSLNDAGAIRIAPMSGAYADLPTDPRLNTAGVAVQALLDAHGMELGLDLKIQKGVPLIGGMGSSASSAVAAVVAANELLELSLSPMDLLPFVLEGERSATGVPHADNAAPSLLGGFTLIRSSDPLDIVSLVTPDTLVCVLVHPHMFIKTKYAREILPEAVSLRTATRQMGHVAGFIAGLYTGNLELMRRSMIDELAEPYRGVLIPGYQSVKDAALDAGALGCGISGSGPSMFALCSSQTISRQVGSAMLKTFAVVNLESDLFLSRISPQGACILD